jgi:presenilin-like A22 family membrane protease
MVLSALAVIFINTPESVEAGQQAVSSSYNVYGDASEQAGGTAGQMSAALVNSLVIVSVVCFMTFVIVVLYKYRCMKILITYMVLATGLLLGYISSVMFRVAIDRYRLTVDKFSFWFFIYNFALVGTLAIFFGRGIPQIVQQGYLVANSVIVAWQLSYFDSWTAWALLVMLALYDLFAVLSPCGPLKALVKLMQKDDAPNMPGLLYEASLPRDAVGAAQPQRGGAGGGPRATNHPSQTPSTSSVSTPSPGPPPMNAGETIAGSRTPDAVAASTAQDAVLGIPSENADPETGRTRSILKSEEHASATGHSTSSDENDEVDGNGGDTRHSMVVVASLATGDVELAPASVLLNCPRVEEEEAGDRRTIGPTRLGGGADCVALGSPEDAEHQGPYAPGPVDVEVNERSGGAPSPLPEPAPTAYIPLALARMYKLRLVDDPRPRWLQPQPAPLAPRPTASSHNSGEVGEDDPEGQSPAAASESEDYTPEELNSLVHVVFPPNGGRIQAQAATAQSLGEPTRYDVLDRDGIIRRTLVVRDGRVFRVVPVDDAEGSSDDGRSNKRARSTIKLGLGDFIFYSILVSEAAMYSYTTFCVCTLVIIDGLGMTLLLLAVYGKALPALPISIFLGVTFFLLTRYFIQPWIETIFISQLYV